MVCVGVLQRANEDLILFFSVFAWMSRAHYEVWWLGMGDGLVCR
jgi:hypothetical protein